MDFFRNSLQNKLAFSAAVALFTSLILATIINNYLLESLLDKRLSEKELPSVLREIRNDIERELATPVAVSRSLAENQFIINWMRNNEPESAFNTVISTLKQLKQSFDTSATFIVSGVTNTYYNENGILKKLSPDDPKDDWFYSFLKEGKAYSIDIDIDESSNRGTVFINYAILFDGAMKGVGGVGRTLDEMTNLIQNYTIGKTGFVYLVSEDGDVTLHPDKSISGKAKLRDLPGMATVSDRLLSSKQYLQLESTLDGQATLVASIPIPSLGYKVIAQMPKQELYSELHEVILTTTLISLAIAIVFILLIILLVKNTIKPIKTIAQHLLDIGNRGGDLTLRLEENRNDEVGDLSRGFNGFVDKLNTIIKQVKVSGDALESTVTQVTENISNTNDRTHEQQSKTELVATAVNQMGSTVLEIARNANDAANYTQTTKEEAASGLGVLKSTIENIHALAKAMNDSEDVVRALAKEVDTISNVLDVIRGISEQTNLLALNAAIEAARAGEQGRGFAVVADEVRTLASRTHNSIEEIRLTIEKLQTGASSAVESMHSGKSLTQQGVQLATDAGQSLDTISANIEKINDMNHQVAVATEQQTSVTEDINQNVTSIADLAKTNANDVKSCKNSCEKMHQLSSDLIQLMKQFKTD